MRFRQGGDARLPRLTRGRAAQLCRRFLRSSGSRRRRRSSSIQQIFDPLTVDRGITEYVTTEFGIGLAIAQVVLAWIFWRKRGELPQVLVSMDAPLPEPAPLTSAG